MLNYYSAAFRDLRQFSYWLQVKRLNIWLLLLLLCAQTLTGKSKCAQRHKRPRRCSKHTHGGAWRPTAECQLFVPIARGDIRQRKASSVWNRNFGSQLSSKVHKLTFTTKSVESLSAWKHKYTTRAATLHDGFAKTSCSDVSPAFLFLVPEWNGGIGNTHHSFVHPSTCPEMCWAWLQQIS